MGKIRVTYDVEFKKKAVDLYLKVGMSYKTNEKELGIKAVIRRKRPYHGKKRPM